MATQSHGSVGIAALGGSASHLDLAAVPIDCRRHRHPQSMIEYYPWLGILYGSIIFLVLAVFYAIYWMMQME